ncbi:MAG: TusE/DsrC/DsvC family sulfur relay protein [Ekhidna sp.]|uniref:TusE/DsrC/DsvC family sulfur relay protein n=1 Tax=Ekhidna sp. TaxID=2608089 RepID=UPI0032F08CAE
METLIANRPVEVNEQGYLLHMDQWDKEIARYIAAEEDIELTDRHFEILQYLRDEQEKGTALSIRRVGKSGVVDIKEFYKLFPNGPLKKASRIAGIPKPASCI